MNQENRNKLNMIGSGCALVTAGLSRAVQLINQIRVRLAVKLAVSIAVITPQDPASANPYRMKFQAIVSGAQGTTSVGQWNTNSAANIIPTGDPLQYNPEWTTSGNKVVTFQYTDGEGNTATASLNVTLAPAQVNNPTTEDIVEVSPNVSRVTNKKTSYLHSDFIGQNGDRLRYSVYGAWGTADIMQFTEVPIVDTGFIADGTSKLPDATLEVDFNGRFNQTFYSYAQILKILPNGGGEQVAVRSDLNPFTAPASLNNIEVINIMDQPQNNRRLGYLHMNPAYVPANGETTRWALYGGWGNEPVGEIGIADPGFTGNGSQSQPDFGYYINYAGRQGQTFHSNAQLIKIVNNGDGTNSEVVLFANALPDFTPAGQAAPPAGESYALYPEGYQIGPGQQNIPIPNNKFVIPDASEPDNSFYYVYGEIKWVSGSTNTLYFKGGDVVTESGDAFDYSFRFNTNAPADGQFHSFITSSTGNNSIKNENVIIGFGAIANPPTAILRNVKLVRR